MSDAHHVSKTLESPRSSARGPKQVRPRAFVKKEPPSAEPGLMFCAMRPCYQDLVSEKSTLPCHLRPRGLQNAPPKVECPSSLRGKLRLVTFSLSAANECSSGIDWSPLHHPSYAWVSQQCNAEDLQERSREGAAGAGYSPVSFQRNLALRVDPVLHGLRRTRHF